MTDVKFEGEIHKHKDGLVAKFDRLNDVAEEHDHKCRPFKTDEAAETFLLDCGVDLEDIQRIDHTTPEHKKEGMEFMADMLGEVAKGLTERLETVNRLKALAPDSGYDFDDIKHLESDALQVMVILAKYGMPIHPEALEGKLSEQTNARG